MNARNFFAAQPDTPGKLAAFAHAFEFLEIGGYEQLVRVARRANDDEVEPFLLREQFVVRTPRGRVATPRAFQLLGREPQPRPDINLQPGLFE